MLTRRKSNQRNTCKKLEKEPEIIDFELFLWSECGDLNSGPLGPEPSALPAALHPVKLCYYTPFHILANEKLSLRNINYINIYIKQLTKYS